MPNVYGVHLASGEAGGAHSFQHLGRLGKTLDRVWQVVVGPTNARKGCADLRKHVAKIEAIHCTESAFRLAAFQDAALSAWAQHAQDFL